ncbi:HlyD family efflux transporter periplasmic adaptor subunit [Elioraea rosea]|uniref:HlyD family efflux transporter periplasmic adaptor subunit n=1 Tax=Elioraea rosea TaxID=2492390 RepID=UPI001181DB24|nr:HlyD family efflux transporter periplasmic adaptor subunit [Elioraea rosea]
MKRSLLAAMAALAVVPLAGLFLIGEPLLGEPPAPAQAADTQAATGVGALGRVEPASRIRRVTRAAGAEGVRILSIEVGEGEEVEAGRLLARFDDLPKKQAALERAEAQVALADARLSRLLAAGRDTEIAAARARVAAAAAAEESARREADRAARLLRSVAGNEATWDRARFAAAQATAERTRAEADLATLLSPRDEDLAVARAELTAAEAAAREARADRDTAQLVAPIAGRVLKVHARAGEKVGEDGVLELADLDALDVVAEVFETDLPRVRQGARAEVIVPGEAQRFGATVRQIGWMVGRSAVVSADPVASIDARVVEVRLALEQPGIEALARRSNMQVQVRILP